MDRIDEIVSYVDGGVCQNFDEICQACLGCNYDDLSKENQANLADQIFHCEQCNWTLPSDDLGETEESDGFLCKECEDEALNDEDD